MLQLTCAGSGRKSLLIGKTSTVFTSTFFAFAWASSTRSAAVMQCIDVDDLVFSPPCGADRVGSVMDSTPEGEYAVMVYEPSPLASGPSTVSDVLDNAPSSSQGVNEEGRLEGRNWQLFRGWNMIPSIPFLGHCMKGIMLPIVPLWTGAMTSNLNLRFRGLSPLRDSRLSESSSLVQSLPGAHLLCLLAV